MNTPERQPSFGARLVEGIWVFAGDVAGGCVAFIRNSLALLGVAVVLAVALIVSQADLRHQAQTRLTAWLTKQQMAQTQAPVDVEQTAVDRATAADPQALPPDQARLALWLARKYQVAPEPVAALVAGAYEAGQPSHIDPALILAVMAIESNFNPFAQSTAGAQGLMQVMTRVHIEKYDGYGGQFAAFDPLSNLRVGVWVLRDCIDKTGSIGKGLRCYVGATHLKTDRGYVDKVLTEYARLQRVIAQAQEVNVPASVPNPVNATAPAPRSNQTAKAGKRKTGAVVVASVKTSE